MPTIKQFDHLKIQLAAIVLSTNNFSEDHRIGKGGFGSVYKGELVLRSNGQSTMVAIKRLEPTFGQGNPEFWKEIITLCLYKHENIVSLLGFCDESREKILVYEYATKGSLDFYLNSSDLTWIRRLKICIGAARGLAYFHNSGSTQQRLLHRDIKSSNILLDENWNARISDLGLSKFGPANQEYTFLVSNTVGTIGYCDPLYMESGLLTKESDVYSFGVVLFEVLCGRLCIRNNDDKLWPLTRLVRKHYKENKINELICSYIQDEISPRSLMAFTEIAYQCLKIDHEERPLMTQVVSELEKALEYQLCTLQANAEYSKVMDILDSSHLIALRLPDPTAAGKVMQLIYTDDESKLIVLASTGIIKVWNWKQKSSASLVPGLWQPYKGAVMCNDLSGSRPPEESAACLALLKNSGYMLSASGGNVSLFFISTFQVTVTFMPFPSRATFLALHPEDNYIIAIGMEDATIDIYNLQLGDVIIRLEGHQKHITGLAFSEALNSLVSSGSDVQLCMWSIDGWNKLKSRSLQSPPGYLLPLAGDTKIQYHNDQLHLLVVHESHIAIYDHQLECLKLWFPRESISAPISSATYSCDGQIIFAGFLNGAVGIFDAKSLSLQCRISPFAYISPSVSSNSPAYPMVIAAHPSDPLQLALGMSDGSVYVIEPADADE